jgi:hypothetical protein
MRKQDLQSLAYAQKPNRLRRCAPIAMLFTHVVHSSPPRHSAMRSASAHPPKHVTASLENSILIVWVVFCCNVIIIGFPFWRFLVLRKAKNTKRKAGGVSFSEDFIGRVKD